MKSLSLFGLSAVVAASMAMSVMAEEVKAPDAVKGHKGQKQEICKKADVNGDGKLSLEEFKTMCTKGDAEAKFAAADADKDGFVTCDELKAAKKSQCGKKGCGKGPKKGPAADAPVADAPAVDAK